MHRGAGGIPLEQTKYKDVSTRSGHFAFVSTRTTDDGKEVQSELESAMIHGENHKVECLSFNFSLTPNGEVDLLSIVQKDEAGEAVGGEVRTCLAQYQCCRWNSFGKWQAITVRVMVGNWEWFQFEPTVLRR